MTTIQRLLQKKTELALFTKMNYADKGSKNNVQNADKCDISS